VAAGYSLPGDRPSNSGSGTDWRLAARSEPLGGLDYFRLVAIGAAPDDNPADYDLCVCCVKQ